MRTPYSSNSFSINVLKVVAGFIGRGLSGGKAM